MSLLAWRKTTGRQTERGHKVLKEHEVGMRVRDLKERTRGLRQQVGMERNCEDDNLWMSSLDIIGELLNLVEHLAQDDGDGEKMSLSCPSCHATVAVPYEALVQAVAACPACGVAILLANPT